MIVDGGWINMRFFSLGWDRWKSGINNLNGRTRPVTPDFPDQTKPNCSCSAHPTHRDNPTDPGKHLLMLARACAAQ
jgi:hypothetical protein